MLLLLPPAGPPETCRRVTDHSQGSRRMKPAGTAIGLWCRELLGLAGLASWTACLIWLLAHLPAG